MKHYLIIYTTTLLVMALLDMIFLVGIAHNFYKSRIDNLEFHAAPAVAFYLIYAAGVVIFANGNPNAHWQTVLFCGALFGFFAYATYDLTNLATLKGWSPLLVAVDMAWGTLVTSATATAGFLITRYLESQIHL